MTEPRQARGAGRPTLRDVADRAGVSTSTASLVYSGKRAVSPGTAERVLAAAAALGYAGPDPLASSLRQGRSGVVGVHYDDALRYAFADPFAVSVLDGLSQVLDELGLGMLLASRHGQRDHRSVLDQQALDAVVLPLCGPEDDPLVDRLAARGIPVIGTGAHRRVAVPRVRVDEQGAMRRVVAHLRALGHARIGHVAMPMGARRRLRPLTADDVAAASYPDSRERAEGFLAAATPAETGLVVEAAALTIEAGEAAGALLLDTAGELPTAVAAQSDLLAAGVVRAARARGLRVPEDLSVTGVDGVDLPWFDGTLTTVVQDGGAKGRLLGDLVRRSLAGEPTADVDLATPLRVGTTTAAPPR